METLPLILASILFIIGILGTFLPILPGAILIWLGMLLYGYLTEFENLSVYFYIIQGLAVALVTGVDYIATALGTKKFNGSRASMWGASIGLLVGILILGPFGIILGPLIGALLGEFIVSKSFEKAVQSSIGALVGILGGFFVKLTIAIAMIIWFFITII